MIYIVEMFTVSLLLTWVIEIPVGYVMGLRGSRYVCLMLLINLLTNPAAVLLHLLGIPQLLIEIGVVAVEAAVYTWFSRDSRWEINHPILLSVTANMVSWICGILIQIVFV